jgi:hypothetical protein
MIAALLVAASTACALPQGEVAAQLALDYDAFERREGPAGWRVLNASGCTDAAVSLLSAYASANDSRLTDGQRNELAFHAGQVLALAGREAQAIAHFERATAGATTAEWRLYVEATLAFLRRDKDALAAARAAYAASAPGSIRLRFIDGLVACPAEAYAKAVHCRM